MNIVHKTEQLTLGKSLLNSWKSVEWRRILQRPFTWHTLAHNQQINAEHYLINTAVRRHVLTKLLRMTPSLIRPQTIVFMCRSFRVSAVIYLHDVEDVCKSCTHAQVHTKTSTLYWRPSGPLMSEYPHLRIYVHGCRWWLAYLAWMSMVISLRNMNKNGIVQADYSN